MTPAVDPTEMLDGANAIAVVGVSADPSKYGHKVFFDLLDAGYQAYAVHREGGEVKGHTRYPDLASLPFTPHVVTTVVPPRVTEAVVRQCAELGIGRVWMQPGSESEAALEACHEAGIRVLSGACIMIERLKR